MPGSHVYYDQDTNEEGEIDLFKDGSLGLDLQLIGFDMYYPLNDGKVQVGSNFGFGTATAMEGAPAALFSVAGYAQFGNALRFDVGWMVGFTAKEGLTRDQMDDNAIFVGFSLPTNFGDILKGLF